MRRQNARNLICKRFSINRLLNGRTPATSLDTFLSPRQNANLCTSVIAHSLFKNVYAYIRAFFFFNHKTVLPHSNIIFLLYYFITNGKKLYVQARPAVTTDQFYVQPASQIPTLFPPFQPFQPNGSGPFGLGLLQRIGNKISNTAEFLAEMVRTTVKVICALNRIH